MSKVAEAKEYDLRRTGDVLEGAQLELARLKDESGRLSGDNVAL